MNMKPTSVKVYGILIIIFAALQFITNVLVGANSDKLAQLTQGAVDLSPQTTKLPVVLVCVGILLVLGIIVLAAKKEISRMAILGSYAFVILLFILNLVGFIALPVISYIIIILACLLAKTFRNYLFNKED